MAVIAHILRVCDTRHRGHSTERLLTVLYFWNNQKYHDGCAFCKVVIIYTMNISNVVYMKYVWKHGLSTVYTPVWREDFYGN